MHSVSMPTRMMVGMHEDREAGLDGLSGPDALRAVTACGAGRLTRTGEGSEPVGRQDAGSES